MVSILAWELVVIIVSLALSAFFSGSETAITLANKLRMRRLAREGNAGARAVVRLLDAPSRMISAILVGNNIVNITISVLTAHVFITLMGDTGVPLATATATLAILLFGEITPKTVAAHNADRIGPALARPLAWWTDISYPFARRLLPLAGWINASLGDEAAGGDAVTKEEIRMLVESGETAGVIEVSEKRMIESILDLREARAKDVMVPRPDMVCVEAEATFKDVLRAVAESGFSHIPVYEGNRDNILGIACAQDLLDAVGRDDTSVPLRTLIRPVLFVPESMHATELLKELKKAHNHLAIVVDEFGSTAGLVTIEDVLGRVVGEIRDEYDREQQVTALGEGHAIVDGSMAISDANKRFGLALVQEDAHTLAGFVYALFGRIPQVGESVDWSDARAEVEFTVERMERNRVSRVRVEVTRRDGEGTATAAPAPKDAPTSERASSPAGPASGQLQAAERAGGQGRRRAEPANGRRKSRAAEGG